MSGSSSLGGLELCLAVAVLLDDGGVDAERDVVHEQTVADRRVVDEALDAVAKGDHALARVFLVETQVLGEVVARAGRDADEGDVVLVGDRGDESLRAVAAGHAQAVGAAGDRLVGQVGQVEPSVEEDHLDAHARRPCRPDRTSRPCRRPTTDCRAAPAGAGERASWCAAGRARAGRARARRGRPGPPRRAPRRPPRSAGPGRWELPTACTMATPIVAAPATRPASPTARRGRRSVSSHQTPHTAAARPARATTSHTTLRVTKTITSTTKAAVASSERTASKRRRNDGAPGSPVVIGRSTPFGRREAPRRTGAP